VFVEIYEMLRRACLGASWGRGLLKNSRLQVQDPLKALEILGDTPDSIGSDYYDEPIFILSAGWRSGSTLLQRMLFEDDELMVWGEPYHRSNIIDSLLSQLTSLQSEWPPKNYYAPEFSNDNLSEQWIANCWPNITCLRRAHLSYFKSLFEEPLEGLSKSKWGVKEVRWGRRHVKYLKWLYPKAKFVYLCRNPFDAYASFYHYPRAAFLSWPDEPILIAKQYARMWLSMVSEFEGLQAEGYGMLVKYENLKDPATLIKLEQYLGGKVIPPLNLSNLATPQQKNSEKRVQTKNYLPKIEKYLLKFYLGKKIEKYGYYQK